VTNSVVSSRAQGNPKNIKTWDDLDQGPHPVITPNPSLRGRALERDGGVLEHRSSWARHRPRRPDYLKALSRRGRCRTTARARPLQTFTGGKGDVFLSYENDAIFAQTEGPADRLRHPDQTILIECPRR